MIPALLLLASLAGAQQAAEAPTCDAATLEALPVPEPHLAVAWVGPWRRSPHGTLQVVPVDTLNAWIRAQDPPWRGRTLQWLGLRKRNTDPRRRFKVVVYEVDRAELCRPLDDIDKGTVVGEVAACAPRHGRPGRDTAGCGKTLDRRTGEDGPAVYRVRRRDARRRGWAVVPLARYLREISGREVPDER